LVIISVLNPWPESRGAAIACDSTASTIPCSRMVLEKSRRSTTTVRIASAVDAFLGEGTSERTINTKAMNADVATAAQTGQRPRWGGAGICKACSPGGWGGVWTGDAAFVAANKIGRNSRGTY
jgi:hypothetical protein